MICLMKRTV